jgi:hypothetical protein
MAIVVIIGVVVVVAVAVAPDYVDSNPPPRHPTLVNVDVDIVIVIHSLSSRRCPSIVSRSCVEMTDRRRRQRRQREYLVVDRPAVQRPAVEYRGERGDRRTRLGLPTAANVVAVIAVASSEGERSP